MIILRIPKIIIKNFYFFSSQSIRMSGKNINSNDKKIIFYKNKRINNIKDIDVHNLLVSKKESYGNKNSFRYYIEYNDNDIIRPLRIKLPQMTVCFREINENAIMMFRVTDKQLFKNFNKIWKKS